MQSTSYLYRPVLKKAWAIAKKYPSLWILGILSMIFSIGSEYEIILRAVYNSSRDGIVNAFLDGINKGLLEATTLTSQNFWINSWNIFINNIGSATTALFIFACAFLVLLLLIWLSICAQIAIIYNIYLIDKDKKTTLNEAFNFAFANFLPIMLAVILFKIFLFLMFFGLGFLLWLVANWGWLADIIYILFFVIFISISLILAFLIKYQIFYILLKKKDFVTAFKDGWNLFVKNWLISLEMAVLVFFIFLIGTIISAFLISIFFAIPIIIVPYYFSVWPVFLKISISVLSLIGVVATTIIINTLFTLMQWACWVLLFSRLEKGEAKSSIEKISATIKELPQLIMSKN